MARLDPAAHRTSKALVAPINGVIPQSACADAGSLGIPLAFAAIPDCPWRFGDDENKKRKQAVTGMTPLAARTAERAGQ
jgi:hypothetical protein